MILSMKQGQQQKQKLTQEQSFFLDILKFNKEELMDYLEKEYQENPLIDFDRRVFNKEGVSFEEDLSDIENNAVKESLQDHLLQQTGFLSKRVPENIAEFLIYSLDRNGYLREESINEVIKFFPEYTEEQVGFYQIYAADGTDGGICKKPAGMYGASAAGIGIKI